MSCFGYDEQSLSLGTSISPQNQEFSLFQQWLPASFVEQAQRNVGIRHHNRLYTAFGGDVASGDAAAIRRRAAGKRSIGTVARAAGQLLAAPLQTRTPVAGARPSLSSHAGAYHQARQRLPLSVVQESCDRAATVVGDGNFGVFSVPMPLRKVSLRWSCA
jgi:hypothetical protein